ncbi:hypothetical protein FGIG_00705 [Fasciola gigantica]|uniref:Uncharacterized protein n=1 Tax=Fasciola gigantica TaxID=46835 RepID=A0A504YHR5_FASGI|nr:hypothetical protein FGIG_00705 [Fasciola gigantica]
MHENGLNLSFSRSCESIHLHLVIMDLEVDSMFTGLCSAVIVCVVSVVLYFMFKRAVFTPARSVTSLLDAVSSKKRSKKVEIKKAKKVKKHKHAGESGDPLEQERAQTSEETVDDDDSVSTDELEKKVFNLNSFTTKTDEGAVDNKVSKRIDSDHIQVPSDTSKNMEIKTIQMCEVEQSSCPPVSTVPLDKLSEVVDIVQPAGVAVTDSCEESFPVADLTQKASVSSKRSKKRSGKRTTEPSKLASNPLGTVQPSEVITKSTIIEATFAERIHPTSDALLTEAQEELRKLTDQLRNFQFNIVNHVEVYLFSTVLIVPFNAHPRLRAYNPIKFHTLCFSDTIRFIQASDQKLQEVAHHATLLSEENERLRAKEEEQTLGLHVLQNEYRELLRTNKSIEHDKHLKEVKLQTLETERATLRARLDQTKAESGRLQTEADREIRELRDQLTEGKAKLASMAAAMASAPPPGPSPELVRAQEMTQVSRVKYQLVYSDTFLLLYWNNSTR